MPQRTCRRVTMPGHCGHAGSGRTRSSTIRTHRSDSSPIEKAGDADANILSILALVGVMCRLSGGTLCVASRLHLAPERRGLGCNAQPPDGMVFSWCSRRTT